MLAFARTRMRWHADLYLIEQPPTQGHLPTIQAWQDIVSQLRELGFDVTNYQPGNWKPIARAQRWDKRKNMKRLSDQHQRDALCLYLYWVWLQN